MNKRQPHHPQSSSLQERALIEFSLFPEYSRLTWVSPEQAQYQAQKGLRFNWGSNQKSLALIEPLPCPPALQDHRLFLRSWHNFFGRRLHAAWQLRLQNFQGLFPGNTICRIDRNGQWQHHYRGSLLWEQYCLGRGLIPPEEPSPEKNRAQPDMVKLPGNTASGSIVTTRRLMRHLALAIKTYCSFNLEKAQEILSLINQLWTSTRSKPTYDPLALNIAAVILTERLTWTKDLSQVLPVLFELEGYASYISASRSLDLIGTGFFAGNWIEIATLPLFDLKQTEECHGKRLFDELLTLPARGFAPIVINEHKMVTDGNHRIMAARIWNILRDCLLRWQARSELDLRQTINKYALSPSATDDLSQRQALEHLKTFASSEAILKKLVEAALPDLRNYAAIESLPVVLLPEYISGAVFKDPFDEEGALLSFPPQIYKIISRLGSAILPPRVAYHFTDCTALPWFAILK